MSVNIRIRCGVSIRVLCIVARFFNISAAVILMDEKMPRCKWDFPLEYYYIFVNLILF